MVHRALKDLEEGLQEKDGKSLASRTEFIITHAWWCVMPICCACCFLSCYLLMFLILVLSRTPQVVAGPCRWEEFAFAGLESRNAQIHGDWRACWLHSNWDVKRSSFRPHRMRNTSPITSTPSITGKLRRFFRRIFAQAYTDRHSIHWEWLAWSGLATEATTTSGGSVYKKIPEAVTPTQSQQLS